MRLLDFLAYRTKTGGVFMYQHSYSQDVIMRFGMESCMSGEIPFDPRIRLCKSDAYVSTSGVKSATLQGEKLTSTGYLLSWRIVKHVYQC